MPDNRWDPEGTTEKSYEEMSPTFPLHLFLSMIFRANSFPVDLEETVQLEKENSANKTTVPATQGQQTQQSFRYNESESCSEHRRNADTDWLPENINV